MVGELLDPKDAVTATRLAAELGEIQTSAATTIPDPTLTCHRHLPPRLAGRRRRALWDEDRGDGARIRGGSRHTTIRIRIRIRIRPSRCDPPHGPHPAGRPLLVGAPQAGRRAAARGARDLQEGRAVHGGRAGREGLGGGDEGGQARGGRAVGPRGGRAGVVGVVQGEDERPRGSDVGFASLTRHSTRSLLSTPYDCPSLSIPARPLFVSRGRLLARRCPS